VCGSCVCWGRGERTKSEADNHTINFGESFPIKNGEFFVGRIQNGFGGGGRVRQNNLPDGNTAIYTLLPFRICKAGEHFV
jgi:hypothetical protein